MLLKNRSMAGLFWVVPMRLLLEVVASIVYITQVPGGLKRSSAVMRALGCNIRQIARTLQKRRQVQKSRVVLDRIILRHSPLSQFMNF